MRSPVAEVCARAVLPDVVAELGKRNALDVVELRTRRGEVGRRPSLDEKQTFVALVFRISTTDRGVAGRVGVRCETPDARETCIRKRDRSICRASGSVKPGSLNEMCLPWVELLRLDLEESGRV